MQAKKSFISNVSQFCQKKPNFAPNLEKHCFVCLLSCIAFHEPLGDDEVVSIREAERSLEAGREKVGLSRYLAIGAKTRVPGPLWPFFDAAGREVLETSNLHPFGPKRRKYRTADSDDEALDDGICPASRYAVCSMFCVLCRGV